MNKCFYKIRFFITLELKYGQNPVALEGSWMKQSPTPQKYGGLEEYLYFKGMTLDVGLNSSDTSFHITNTMDLCNSS